MRAGQYRRALDRISRNVADVARSVGRFLQTTERTDADLADAARVLHPVIAAGREQSRQAALAFMEGQARIQGYQDTLPVPAPRDYPVGATQKALKDTVGGETVPASVESMVAKVAVRHSEDAARKAVEDTASMSAEPDPKTGKSRPVVGWARQLTGAENCPFCVIMASRGAVYHSRQTALYSGGDQGVNDLNDGMGRYHNGCDCVAVPVYDLKKWDGNATARRLYRDVYRKALEKYPDDDAFTAVRKFMISDLDDDGLRVPQMRNGDVEVPDQDDVPDFVSSDLLSPETVELIDGMKDRLPRTKEEWEEIRKSSGKTHRQARRDQVAEFYEGKAKTATSRAKDYAKTDPDYAAEYKAQAKKHRAYAKEVRAGKRDVEEVIDYTVEMNGLVPDEGVGYETDVNGKILPPQSYLDRVDEVQKVGRSAMADYQRALDTDVQLKTLVEERDAADRELEARMAEVIRLQREDAERRRAARTAVDEPDSGSDDDIDAWLEKMSQASEDATEVEFDRALEAAQARGEEARLAARAARDAATARRGDLLHQVVGSRRPMASRDDITVTPGRADPRGNYGAERPGTEDDLEKIRKAATAFPKEWVEKMEAERGGLYVTFSDRAYYRAKNPFSTNPGDHINLCDYGRNYQQGYFGNYMEQIAAHEIGHRMEKTLPAIARLEWAYLARRATSKGKRENLKWVGRGAKDEKAFHDGFRNAYTGKAYGDPDSRPWEYDAWEVFTTGLESLYGDDTAYQDSDGDLQSFILGILLSV